MGSAVLTALLRPRVELLALLPLAKYSDNQPRDDRGRFGQMGAAEIPRAAPGSLSTRARGVESRFARQLSADIPKAIADYAKLPDTAGGKILNTDTVRELSRDYQRNRSALSPAVHEPASHFTKVMYAQRLAQAPVSNSVLFTAGGAGAGKSSGIKAIPGMQGLQDRADVVYDTNMNKFGSAREKIDQALATGRDVHIAYVARDPIEALTHGALPRAMGTGGGRTVPLAEHARTHTGAAQTIQQLQEHYANDPRVSIHYIDNTRERGGAALADRTLPSKLNFENLPARLDAALKVEHEAGRISTKIFEGTRNSGH